MGTRHQKLSYNKDLQAFAVQHRQRVETLVKSDFPRKVRIFDDLLQTEQFSMSKLANLIQDTRAVVQMGCIFIAGKEPLNTLIYIRLPSLRNIIQGGSIKTAPLWKVHFALILD